MSSSNVLPQPASIDEKLATLDSVPLFMKSLPADSADDTAIEALQSLVYEGTPDKIAQNFKEQGNDYFKGKRYREAIGFYTQGIEAKPTDSKIYIALLCNRAACNLELQNYGSVLRDCSKAIQIDPKTSKAYYRSALALIALHRVEEVLDCCDRCLDFDGENKDVKAVRERALKAKNEKERREREREERIRKEKQAERRLNSAFNERNIIILPNDDQTIDNPHTPHFDPEDPTGKALIFPVFFLYPQHATSDVISHFVEDTQFSAHIAVMFPPEAPAPKWDQAREYNAGQLAVYVTTHGKRLFKVGKKMTLSDVFKASKEKEGDLSDGLELKGGCLTFVVVPKGDAEKKWVDEFKKARGTNS